MPGEDVYSWSTTAASNDDADTAINWREGMARAAVNDSSRSSMAAVAKFRDLLKGTIVTSGTADAQTFVSGIGYTTIPTGLRALLKIGPALTNTGATTLMMDGIASSPVKNKAGADLIGGELVADGYIEVIYDGTNWILAADGKEKVNRSGDTMTGPLTVPSLTSSGAITTATLAASGAITAASLATTGAITAGTTITATGIISTNADLYAEGGNCFLRSVAPQLTLWDTGTAVMGMQCADGGITWGHATTGGALFDNLLGLTGGGNLTVFIGTGLKPGGGAWDGYSDARTKNVVGDYTAGLAEVMQLWPVRYTYKGNDTPQAPEAGDTAPYKNSPNYSAATKATEFIGLVAQETEPHMPEMVTQHNGYIDGVAVSDMRSLSTTALTFALVNCIKELLQRIEALEAKP